MNSTKNNSSHGPIPWHLISFPRSGNHLVRGLLEAASGRKTLGCPGAKNDTPIYKRIDTEQQKILDVDPFKRPVAMKSHFATEIWRHGKKYPGAGVILITRDPVDAISSHLLRGIDTEKKLRLRDYGREIEQLQREYLHLLYVYKSYPEEMRYHIKFKDLMGSEKDISLILSQISKKMNASFRPLTNEKIAEIKSLTKDTQSSLIKPNPIVKGVLRKAIQLRITNKEVEDFLADAVSTSANSPLNC